MLGRRINSHRLGSATPYHPVNSLMVARAELRMEGKRIFNPILSNNQWLVESIDFRNMTMYHLRCTIVGQGTGYLYASFKGDEGQELLTIEKVTAGTHELSSDARSTPLPTLKSESATQYHKERESTTYLVK